MFKIKIFFINLPLKTLNYHNMASGDTTLGQITQKLIMKNLLKSIREKGSKHITDDLDLVIIIGRITDDNYKIEKTVITNTKGEREEIQIMNNAKKKA